VSRGKLAITLVFVRFYVMKARSINMADYRDVALRGLVEADRPDDGGSKHV
jgi:hypothetical protein